VVSTMCLTPSRNASCSQTLYPMLRKERVQGHGIEPTLWNTIWKYAFCCSEVLKSGYICVINNDWLLKSRKKPGSQIA